MPFAGKMGDSGPDDAPSSLGGNDICYGSSCREHAICTAELGVFGDQSLQHPKVLCEPSLLRLPTT
jgi:hypothetical protein